MGSADGCSASGWPASLLCKSIHRPLDTLLCFHYATRMHVEVNDLAIKLLVCTESSVACIERPRLPASSVSNSRCNWCVCDAPGRAVSRGNMKHERSKSFITFLRSASMEWKSTRTINIYLPNPPIKWLSDGHQAEVWRQQSEHSDLSTQF